MNGLQINDIDIFRPKMQGCDLEKNYIDTFPPKIKGNELYKPINHPIKTGIPGGNLQS